ncbi:MAG: DUF1611 domain-containing protein [Planctomycetota bacterium]
MHVLPNYERILLLTEGHLGVFTSKTAAALLRYRADDVVAVIDSVAAGAALSATIPWAPPVPILPRVLASKELQPQALFIGVAPPGGRLPDSMRRHVLEALQAGLDVVSGLHTWLEDDDELVTVSQQTGARILDLRKPPEDQILASGRAVTTRCRRVLTVGTDGNVGKMVAALELTAAATRCGLRAEFLATGQTGIMIDGRGVAIDALVSDFAPGATEALVLSAADADVCFVEGQGSLGHPGFSAVSLALLHGTCPDALILVHHAGRTHYRVQPERRLPPLRELRAIYEQVASLLHPARVVGVALNPFGQDSQSVQAEMRRIERELAVPVADPASDGVEHLLAAAMTE